MIYKFLLLFMIILSSCNESQMKSMNQPDKPLKELKEKVIKTGDVQSYEELSTAYMDYSIGEFLPYALLMANKYNYPRAYYDVYESLVLMQSVGQGTIDSLDPKTLTMALEYLKLSSEKGLLLGKKILGQYYIDGKYLSKDTIKGNQLLRESGEK